MFSQQILKMPSSYITRFSLLVVGVLAVPFSMLAQNTDNAPSTAFNLVTIISITAVISTALTAVVAWYTTGKKINTAVEEAVKHKVDKLVDQKISEKIGVRTAFLHAYFSKLQSNEILKEKRILILNKNLGKDYTLAEQLEKDGYKSISFQLFEPALNELNVNHFDLVLFDNRDGELEESQTIEFINRYKLAFKYVCFTCEDWTQESYSRYRDKVKFVKDSSKLSNAITQCLVG